MLKRACLIAGAGEFYHNIKKPENISLIIGADGGYEYLQNSKITPDIIIGDFDSAGQIPNHPNVIYLPCEKDDTDMMSAVKLGLQKGCNEFHIYGGTGGRLDHTIANIQTLAYITEHDSTGYLYDKDIVITILKNGILEFHDTYTGIISVFAYSDKAIGVDLKGFRYELDDTLLSNHFPVGVSNEFIGKKSCISIQNGLLLVIYPNL